MLPPQIVAEGLALILSVSVDMVINCVALLLHPPAFVPVTVYVVFAVGLTDMLAVVWPEVQR